MGKTIAIAPDGSLVDCEINQDGVRRDASVGIIFDQLLPLSLTTMVTRPDPTVVSIRCFFNAVPAETALTQLVAIEVTSG
jgi:hypothetical protein